MTVGLKSRGVEGHLWVMSVTEEQPKESERVVGEHGEENERMTGEQRKRSEWVMGAQEEGIK